MKNDYLAYCWMLKSLLFIQNWFRFIVYRVQCSILEWIGEFVPFSCFLSWHCRPLPCDDVIFVAPWLFSRVKRIRIFFFSYIFFIRLFVNSSFACFIYFYVGSRCIIQCQKRVHDFFSVWIEFILLFETVMNKRDSERFFRQKSFILSEIKKNWKQNGSDDSLTDECYLLYIRSSTKCVTLAFNFVNNAHSPASCSSSSKCKCKIITSVVCLWAIFLAFALKTEKNEFSSNDEWINIIEWLAHCNWNCN